MKIGVGIHSEAHFEATRSAHFQVGRAFKKSPILSDTGWKPISQDQDSKYAHMGKLNSLEIHGLGPLERWLDSLPLAAECFAPDSLRILALWPM